MKDILVKDIIKITKGILLCGDENAVCNEYSKDTREIKPGDIYLGIKGERFNGSIFYKDALERGAKGCILQDIEITKEDLHTYQDRFIILVEDVVKALQEIATYKRTLYDIPVIGVTGSVGKTSTKDIIASVLSKKYKVLKTEGNYNNEIGMPLTILRLKDHEALVLEMGMSAFKEISLLTRIAKPTTAVITIIGTSHIGELGSRENILKAKLEILEGLKENGAVILNNDDDLLHRWNQETIDSHTHITYGIENKSNLVATNIQVKENGSEYTITVEGKNYPITVPVGGKHYIYNSLAAIGVGLTYEVAMEDIIEGIQEFKLTKRRMETIQNQKGTYIINDSYNASYESVKAALEYLKSINANQKIAVLGDVLELGEFSQIMHEKMGEEVVNNAIDILITVGKEAKYINKKAIELGMDKEKVYHFHTNEEASTQIQKVAQRGDVVLIKASNGMRFDEIVEKIK